MRPTSPHPKDPSINHRPLIRDVRDHSKPIGADQISNHIACTSKRLALPKDAKVPKVRATGSTAAIKKGTRVDVVVVDGNWSSSVLFDKFYRLNAAAATNFTSMVLS
ncbi:hypothetical protein BGZ58_002721 [Dissophora ornata]|nr:hypothetical protein BGZ58_002721 [Dissophora ornata]